MLTSMPGLLQTFPYFLCGGKESKSRPGQGQRLRASAKSRMPATNKNNHKKTSRCTANKKGATPARQRDHADANKSTLTPTPAPAPFLLSRITKKIINHIRDGNPSPKIPNTVLQPFGTKHIPYTRSRRDEPKFRPPNQQSLMQRRQHSRPGEIHSR